MNYHPKRWFWSGIRKRNDERIRSADRLYVIWFMAPQENNWRHKLGYAENI